MKKTALFFLFAVMALFVLLSRSSADTIKCAQCGMNVDLGSKCLSRIVEADKTLLFCDIGDLLTYLNKKSVSAAVAQVRDYKTGEWISAEKAFYVHSEKAFHTPMGWGIAAFKNREDAAAFGAPLDFTAAQGTVK